MTQKLAPSTKAAVWNATATVELPIPALDGSPLAIKLRPIPPLKFADMLGRLAGHFKMPDDGKEDEGLPAPADLQSMAEEVDQAKHELERMLPLVRGLVEAAVVEPSFYFGEDQAPEDTVPWADVDVRNQLAIFKAIMRRGHYEGGAAEQVAGFRVPRRGKGGRVGSLRRGKGVAAQAVRGATVPRRGGR